MAALACLAGLLAACDPEARAQVVLVVDTDLPVPTLADALRVELWSEDGAIESRVVPVRDPSELPLSFGVVIPAGRSVRARLRLHREERTYRVYPNQARAGDEDEPIADYAVDRLLTLDAPAAGIARYLVRLDGDCLAVPADLEADATCVSGRCAGERCESPRAGLEPIDAPPPTRSGAWAVVVPAPCEAAAAPPAHWDEARACIDGGFFYIGDSRVGITFCADAESRFHCNTVPERPVRVPPFEIDRFEVTARRYREAIERGAVTPRLEQRFDALARPLCHLGRPDGDELPMNCVTFAEAAQFCRAAGGALPTEAQWEYVASGRGDERSFTWGNASASCESAAYARIGPTVERAFGISGVDCARPTIASGAECCGTARPECEPALAPARPDVSGWPLDGPQPVGAFCEDRTRDGVFDMGGNVKEWTLDWRRFFGQRDACWDRAGVFEDPRCCGRTMERSPLYGASPPPCDDERETRDDGRVVQVSRPVRGASWAAPPGVLPTSTRWGSSDSSSWEIGFRCVYPSR